MGRGKWSWTAVLGALLIVAPHKAAGYAVLSHEAIIDTLWESSIKPLLLERFPEATPEQLRIAHAYVYGGAIIQDAGYYPFGSKFFSNLTHYVRTGDFVLALIHDSRDLNEYAFALGALSHYSADNAGHPIAINRAVALLYPKLRRRFGKEISYDEAPLAHIRTEFSFDVVQVAHNYYAPEAYHGFIGFEVSENVMRRAFADTYSLDFSRAFPDLELAIGTYRWSVRTVIPEMTRVAWAANKEEIGHTKPGMTKKRFLYNLSRASYEKEWGQRYQRPGLGARFLAFLIRILPKIGPLQKLEIPIPTPDAERLFMASFNTIVDQARTDYRELRHGNLSLSDKNFDLGVPSHAGIYPLSDDTYAHLVDLLAQKQFQGVTPALRDNIVAYYRSPSGRVDTERRPKDWQRLQAELTQLEHLSLAASGGSGATAINAGSR